MRHQHVHHAAPGNRMSLSVSDLLNSDTVAARLVADDDCESDCIADRGRGKKLVADFTIRWAAFGAAQPCFSLSISDCRSRSSAC